MKSTQEIVSNTFSWGRRRKTAKQREGCLRTLRAATGDPIVLDTKPDFHTASWTYRDRTHYITLGLRFPETLMPTASANEGRTYRIAQALLVHETWHGRITTRDLKSVGDTCRAKGIPFSLFNLFEDARIEAHARKDASFTESFPAGRFGWTLGFAQPTETADPVQYFWALVNGESESFSSLSVRAPKWVGATLTARGDGCVPVIRRLFLAACRAKTTMDLIPLMEEWISHFGRNPKATAPRITGIIGAESDGSGGSTPPPSGEYGVATVGGESGAGFSQTGSNGAASTSQDKLDEALGGKLNTGESPTLGGVSIKNFQLGELVARDKDSPMWGAIGMNDLADKVRRQTQRLVNIVAQCGYVPHSTGTTGTRLHLGNAITGQDNAFHRNETKAKGKRKFIVVMDCSGSMVTMHNVHGRAFLLSLTAMHRRGLVNADVWLTGSGAYTRLNLAATSARDLVAIYPNKGCESFRHTLNAIPLREMQEASAVVCYTDGALTDGHVDAGYFRRHNVNLLGCCVAQQCERATDAEKADRRAKYSERLVLHFGRGIVKDNGEQLASALATYFASRKD